MSQQNLVSTSIEPTAKTSIISQLTAIRAQLNFGVSLSDEERKRLKKAGNGMLPFIDKAYAAAGVHPELLPAFISKDEYTRDYALAGDLLPIVNLVHEISEMLDVTLTAVRSDLLGESLEVYASSKRYRDNSPGMAATHDGMATFFQRNAKAAVAAQSKTAS